MLIDSCPRCGAALGWQETHGIERCNRAECAFDLREHSEPSLRAETFEKVGPIGRLLEPDPTIHSPTQTRLHDDFASMDRGVVFELAWRLGRLARGIKMGKGKHRTSLPGDQIVEALSAGAAMLAAWPESIDRLLRSRINEDPTAAMVIVDALRRLAASRTGLPEHAELLRRRAPHVIDTRQRVIRGFSDDLVDGAGALQFLRIGSNDFVKLLRDELIVPVHSSGQQNIHATFSRTALTHLRDAIADRLAIGPISEAFGISRHGVEQLACLGLVDHLDNPALPLLYGGLHVTAGSPARLIKELEGAATCFSDDEQVMPLRRALAAIGGREKPWGSVIAALLEGAIPFAIASEGRRFVDRIYVRRKDVAVIANRKFDCPAEFARSTATSMPRRDAQEVLNLTPVLMSRALKVELQGMNARNKELSTERVLNLARARISGGEVLARYFYGEISAFRSFLPLRYLPRLGATGWAREEAEDLLARSGLHPIELEARNAAASLPP